MWELHLIDTKKNSCYIYLTTVRKGEGMTSQKIKEVSLRYFALSGYEGTSLAQIAEDVGIKKQSIYTHFKGKDELFLHLCKEANETELSFVTNFIDKNSNQPIKEFLYDYLLRSIERYEQYDSTKFWVRTAFFPPVHLNGQVMEKVYDYLDQLEELFTPVIEKAIHKGEISAEIGKERATAAFLGILDGVLVEMFYGGPKRMEKRLDASWYLFSRGLSME